MGGKYYLSSKDGGGSSACPIPLAIAALHDVSDEVHVLKLLVTLEHRSRQRLLLLGQSLFATRSIRLAKPRDDFVVFDVFWGNPVTGRCGSDVRQK